MLAVRKVAPARLFRARVHVASGRELRERIQRSIAEQRAQFVGTAFARRAKYRANGRTVSFDEMEAYAMALARGEQLPKLSDG